MTTPPYNDRLHFLYRSDAGVYKDTAGMTAATADNDAVALWKDQSGNNNHLVQSTSGSRPYLLTNQLSGKPSIVYQQGPFFQFSNVLCPTARTLYALIRIADTGSRTICSGDSAALQWRMDGQKQRLVSGGVSDIGFGSGTMSLNTWTQINAAWDGSRNGSFRMAKAADGTVSVGSDGGYAANRYVGKNGVTAEVFYGDQVLLMAYADVHSTAQRQAVEAWISSEFGV